MDIFKLIGSIFVKNDEANEAIDSTTEKAKSMSTVLGKKMQEAGTKIEKVGKKLTPLSVATGAMLTGSVKGASDFTDAMAKMSTLFDTTETSVEDLSKQFLELSNQTGLSATELAEAGYQALSAGRNVEDVAEFVQTAGNLARAGFTNTTTSVDVLTTAMNAYGESAGSAEEIANKLVRTQNLGKTTVDELANSMGRVIPTASSMGVNIDNLTSGYVSLTKQGIATAEATTYINSMLNELGDSGTVLGGILKEKTGKSFQDLMNEGYSLADVLQITKDYADENKIAYNELWGSAEAGKAGLAILNGGVEDFNDTVKTMGSNVDDVGQALEKLNTPSFKVQESLNRVKNSGVELGTTLINALAPTLDKVSSGIEKVTTWFNSLDDKTKTTIGAVLAFITALAPVLIIGGKIIGGIGTFMTWIPKIKTALTLISGGFQSFFAILAANPIVLVVAGITALVAGFIYLWNTSEGFRNFWINLWEQVKGAFDTAVNFIQVGIMLIGELFNAAIQIISVPFRFIWENCKGILTEAWEAIKNIISAGLDAVKNTVSNGLNAVKTVFTTIWNAIKTALSPILNAIKNVIDTVLNAVKPVVSNVLNSIKSTFSEAWNSVKTVVSTAINAVKNTISTGLNGAKNTVSTILNGIKEKFSSVMEGAKNVVQNAINTIKGKFNFSWSLPKLKLPHPSVSGSFSLNPPSVPHFSIAWYKKAMEDPYLMTKPTVFGLNPVTGQMKAGGEAGDEMIYGKQNLMNDIREAMNDVNGDVVGTIMDLFDRLFMILEQYLPNMGNIYLDGDVLVGGVAGRMDTELGKLYARRAKQ